MEIPFQIIFAVASISIIISAIFYALYLNFKNQSDNKVQKQFEIFYSQIENLCWSFPFTKVEEKISLNQNVFAIFAIDDQEKIKRDFIESLIENKEITQGNFVCLWFKDKRPICKHLSCNVSMPIVFFERDKVTNQNIFGIVEYDRWFTLIRYANNVSIQ